MSVNKNIKQNLEIKDLHGYLETLPETIFDRLYNHPATCLAVFRDLPVLAKQYVMRILFVEQPVSQQVVLSWVNAKQQNLHQHAASVLSDLHVWVNHSLPGGFQGWILNTTFRSNLKIALLGGGSPWTGATALGVDKHAKDASFLCNYAKERWECVLHYMVGSKGGVSGVSRDVIDILLHSRLMKTDIDSKDALITQSGFQFLLMDTPSQVWCFMLQYLSTAANRNMELVETLSFLFQLSFSSVGKDYSTEGMSEQQLTFLQHLREFGLIYQRKRKSQRFYPTQLAVHLASGFSKMSTEVQTDGFLIVETNHRIYAYTDSSLQTALLALFTEPVYRFPNLVVVNLTRDSVRAALSRGISAQQIINFLNAHVHPEVVHNNTPIPPTISDQIKLWEMERDRFKFTDGVSYNQFLSQADFEMLRNYAKELGVLMLDNPSKRLMVVTRAGHDDVKRFWKQHKSS